MRDTRDVWMRLAGSNERIRGRDPERRHWRCYIGDAKEEIPLRSWELQGAVSARNFIPESNPDRDERGLVAWLRVFGDISIDAEYEATIVVKDPP